MDKPKLDRALGLTQATALNMIDMVGIGPFVVLPLVIQMMHGPQAIAAWIAGALLALVDGMIWAELGSAMPKAGGSYVFLRELYGEKTGKFMSFLFVWQTMIQAPLVVASGAIGFAQYLTYLIPTLPVWGQKMVSGGLVLLITGLLYRKIADVGKLSVMLWIGVLGTLCWLIWGGITHFNPQLAFDYPPGAWDFSWVFFAALGQASVKTIYSYLGYYNVCHLGGEIINPKKNIPRSIFISIAGIAVLYLAMNFSVLGAIPWREAQESKFIVSLFFERLYGIVAAQFATGLVLWIAFASLFAVMLGYSRVPFAAAEDGSFFKIFARLHPTKHFPYISLLALGGTAFVFSLLFRLADVITAILAMRIMVQFIGQAVGLMLYRKRLNSSEDSYKMPLYPLPVVLAIAIWACIFVATGWQFMLSGVTVMAIGTILFFALKIGSNVSKI